MCYHETSLVLRPSMADLLDSISKEMSFKLWPFRTESGQIDERVAEDLINDGDLDRLYRQIMSAN